MKAVSIALLAGIIGCTSVQPVWAAHASAFQEKVLYSFCSERNCSDGAVPRAGVIDVNGILYGTTYGGGRGVACYMQGCGTLFSVDPATGAEKVLHSFCRDLNCPDGANPWYDLTAVKGTLYGITAAGGGSSGCYGEGCGTLFSLDPVTGADKVLYSFSSSIPEGDITDAKDVIYGTQGQEASLGAVFALDLSVCPATLRVGRIV